MENTAKGRTCGCDECGLLAGEYEKCVVHFPLRPAGFCLAANGSAGPGRRAWSHVTMADHKVCAEVDINVPIEMLNGKRPRRAANVMPRVCSRMIEITTY